MNFNKSAQIISISDIESFEKRQGFVLPDQYSEFLLRSNGGYPEKTAFDFADGSEGSSLDIIYGITTERILSLELAIEEYRSRMPKNIIPIGEDPGGNYVCVSIDGTDVGKVFFWDHEREADTDAGETPSYDNLSLVADSFNQFIDSLFDDKEDLDED